MIAAVTVLVPDYDAAIAFYVGVLGFDLVEDTDLGHGKRWVLVGPGEGGTRLLLARATGPEQVARIGDQTGGRVFLFLRVADFDGEWTRMKAAGVAFQEEPRTEAYGKVAVFRDPFGNLWDLLGIARAERHEAPA